MDSRMKDNVVWARYGNEQYPPRVIDKEERSIQHYRNQTWQNPGIRPIITKELSPIRTTQHHPQHQDDILEQERFISSSNNKPKESLQKQMMLKRKRVDWDGNIDLDLSLKPPRKCSYQDDEQVSLSLVLHHNSPPSSSSSKLEFKVKEGVDDSINKKKQECCGRGTSTLDLTL